MKKLILPVALIFLAACSSSSNEDKTNSDVSTGANSEETTEVENVQEESSEDEMSNTHQIVGEWRADPKDAGVEILLKANADGTYDQSTAGQMQSGTWEEIDENQVKVENENLENGQTWKIENASEDEMTIYFSTKNGFSKTGVLFKSMK